MSKEIRVTCKGADTLPIDSLIEFQGKLKTISSNNLEKLKRSILKHGFTAPIFVWKGVDYHIIDGHQRIKALCSLREEGYNIPLLPVVYIEADSESEAKEKLLYITSQYGEFSTDGVYEFMEGLEIDFDDLRFTSDEWFVPEQGEIDLDFQDREPTNKDLLEHFDITLTFPKEVEDVVGGYLKNVKREGLVDIIIDLAKEFKNA